MLTVRLLTVLLTRTVFYHRVLAIESPPHQVDISELQVPHAYAEDKCL